MQIPLEPLALLLADVDDAGPGRPQLDEVRSELGVQPPVLDGNAGSCGHGGQQLGLVVECRVVQQGSNLRGSLFDQRGGPTALRSRQLDQPTFDIRVALVVGQPVRQRERRVAERSRESIAKVGRRRVRLEVDEELADRRPGEARVEERDEKRDRRQAERGESRPADLGHRRAAPGSRDEQRGDHDQCEPEGVGEKRQRPAQRAARAQPAGDQDANPGQAVRADERELDPRGGQGGVGVRGDLEQVLRAEVAERHANELERDRGHVRGDDEPPLEPPVQVPAREGEEHVEEDDRRQEVEGLPEREHEIVGCPGEAARKFANPAAIMSGPNRLAGRCHQARRPQRM